MSRTTIATQGSVLAEPQERTYVLAEERYWYSGTAWKERYDRPDGSKSFAWFRLGPYDPHAHEFTLETRDVLARGDVPLYRAQDRVTQGASVVLWVEGERKVDRLNSLGYAATCPQNGAASRPTEEQVAFLAGKAVAVLADNDEPGRKHADYMPGLLRQIGAFPFVVVLPGLPPNGGDVVDWLDAGGTADELESIGTAAFLAALADAEPPAPDWLRGHEVIASFSHLDRPRVLTGFPTLDRATRSIDNPALPGGIRAGDLVLLGGPTGSAKTMLVAQWERQWAENGAFCVGLYKDEGRVPAAVREGQAAGIARDSIEKKDPEALAAWQARPKLQLWYPDPETTTVEAAIALTLARAGSRQPVIAIDSAQVVRHTTDAKLSERERLLELTAKLRASFTVGHGGIALLASRLNRAAVKFKKEKENTKAGASFSGASIEYDGELNLTMRALSDTDFEIAVSKNRIGWRQDFAFYVRLNRNTATLAEITESDVIRAAAETVAGVAAELQNRILQTLNASQKGLTKTATRNQVKGGKETFETAWSQLVQAGAVRVVEEDSQERYPRWEAATQKVNF